VDPATGELKAAIDALTDEMLVMDPTLAGWYRTLIWYARSNTTSDWGGARAAIRGWYRQHLIYNHKRDKASESEVSDMTLVAGTVGNIDPNALCDDESCSQQGEAYKDHRVAHTTRGSKKGQRGECPHCHGKLHNVHDSAQLIAFQCLWKQAYGEDAKKTTVDAVSLGHVVVLIDRGTIAGWADRALLHTVTLAPVALPKGGSAAAAASSPSTTQPASTAPAVTTSGTASPKGPAPTAGGSATPQSTATTDDKAERQRKLRAALKDAKVMP
jgi:hypothetical protein